jgi:hypothetical protein
MLPLTLDDLLPLEEYACRRREFFEAHCRYLDRYRRVRLGPRAQLLFENRQTLWFRVQEIIRVARLADPARLQQELDLYNRLLPGPACLQAALLIEVSDEARLAAELAPWRALQGEHIRMHVGKNSFAGVLITARPEDRCVGAAHWVQFPLSLAGRRGLADFHQPAFFEIALPAYQAMSPLLSDKVRQSLVDDLKMSEKDRQ